MSSRPLHESFPPATVLVMAASRRGENDPVALLQNKSHKCLVEIDGQVMLERVIEALIDSGCFNRIYVSVENEDILRATPRMIAWLDEGRMSFVLSRGNLADSVLSAVDVIPNPLPLIITTGDNALHTPELVRDFMRGFWTHDEDVSLAFTRDDVVLRDYANSGLAFHMLKDGGYSACNLYALRRERSLSAVRVFESGGQFGKRHKRILKAFGVTPFIVYKLKLMGLHGLITLIGRKLRVTIDPVLLDYPFGPIDVDNKNSFDITEETLKKRRGAAAKAP
ncbi:nucleotidyltransferase family protein [Emcibacter sp. SYSU 3D8]|uniref:nucleotidyltransferase family protein n=1 Tax=Emcibacter sp. SYSU 3D8 TaxID=3133969 RepID=UPI0031FE5F70